MKEKKYYTLYKTIKEKIIKSEYKVGEKIESKRIMADKFGCSVITVETAFRALEDEGYITAKERSGYFVNKIDSANFHKEISQKPIINLLDEKVNSPDSEFEYSIWFKTIRKVISEKGEELFIKSPNKGCPILRNAIAMYLLRYRGMIANPEQIIIGSGSEQLYETVLRTLGHNYTYGIENPSYRQIEAVYKSEGVTYKKLKMGRDGIETNQLKEAIDVIHVTPFKSYPTDITAPISKRYEYLNFAKNGKYIIEDDFNSEFFIPGQPIESLYSLDKNNSVIYINTFSKSISPSMRMGYMILPEKLLQTYEENMGFYSCTVPVLDQYILAEFINSGNFERHLNRMRRRIKKAPR